jgi:predicted GNAT family acetyltransferase
VPGVFRIADLHDIALLARWHRDFATTTRPEGWRHAEDPTEHVARRLATGQAQVLWEVGGEPVAMAAASKPIAAMSRIGPVWTPPHRRGRGYGSAVTAAASRWAMAAGASDVVLFTDLANPVSNSIYPKIGYRPVYDAVEVTFIRATPSTNA